MKKILMTAALAAAAFGFAAGADAKNAVVDADGILERSPSFQQAMRQLQGEQQRLQQQFNQQSASMNDAGKQQLSQQLNQQFAQRHAALMRPVLDMFQKAVQQVASQQGVDTVILKNGVVMGQVDLDITDAVSRLIR